jgi:type II secretory pathway predicted ATPase ExeA
LIHLLALAGIETPIIEAPAIESIFNATQGLPRKVNLPAHHTLLAAAVSRSKTVNIEHIQPAMHETN